MRKLGVEIEEMHIAIQEILNVLRCARNNKVPGYFSWKERIWLHQYIALLYQAIEKLEDYESGELPPGAALLIIDTVLQEFNVFPKPLVAKIENIRQWIKIKSN